MNDETPPVLEPEIPIETSAGEEAAPEIPEEGDQPQAIHNSVIGAAQIARDAISNDSLIGVSAVGRDMQAYSTLIGGPAAVGRDLAMEQSFAGVVNTGGAVRMSASKVGLLIAAGPVEMEEGSSVLMTSRQALIFGAAFGAVFGLLRLLSRRR